MRVPGVRRVGAGLVGLVGFLVGRAAPGAAQAPAADGLTVGALIERAFTMNAELGAARAEVEAAEGRVRQAGLRPNPVLDLAGQQNVTGSDNTVSVGVTLPLDLGGRKAGRVGVAEAELAMKRAQVAERERRLRGDIRATTGEVLAARRNLEVTDALLQVNRDALRLVRERVREGSAPALEENVLRVEVTRLEANRYLLESRVAVATLQLKALVGMAPDEQLSVAERVEAAPIPRAREDALARALRARADLEMARLEVALAQARVQKEEAEGRWDASVNVGYQRQRMGFPLNGLTHRGGLRPIDDTFHMVGGGVSITLPVLNRNQGNVQAALAEGRAAERRRQFLELVVRQEVSGALAQHAAAREAADIYAGRVRELARQNLDVIRQSQALGRIPLLDVIAEQRRFLDVEMGYTDALKQVWDATVEIERATGAPLR